MSDNRVILDVATAMEMAKMAVQLNRNIVVRTKYGNIQFYDDEPINYNQWIEPIWGIKKFTHEGQEPLFGINISASVWLKMDALDVFDLIIERAIMSACVFARTGTMPEKSEMDAMMSILHAYDHQTSIARRIFGEAILKNCVVKKQNDSESIVQALIDVYQEQEHKHAMEVVCAVRSETDTRHATLDTPEDIIHAMVYHIRMK